MHHSENKIADKYLQSQGQNNVNMPYYMYINDSKTCNLMYLFFINL